jgi:hypothetical protein
MNFEPTSIRHKKKEEEAIELRHTTAGSTMSNHHKQPKEFTTKVTFPFFFFRV